MGWRRQAIATGPVDEEDGGNLNDSLLRVPSSLSWMGLGIPGLGALVIGIGSLVSEGWSEITLAMFSVFVGLGLIRPLLARAHQRSNYLQVLPGGILRVCREGSIQDFKFEHVAEIGWISGSWAQSMTPNRRNTLVTVRAVGGAETEVWLTLPIGWERRRALRSLRRTLVDVSFSIG